MDQGTHCTEKTVKMEETIPCCKVINENWYLVLLTICFVSVLSILI